MHGIASGNRTLLCPTLARVPSQSGVSSSFELTIKATASGVTFLGHWDDERKKYVTTRTYKKRYTGSKQSAVDINGNLWEKSIDLEREISKTRDKNKKSAHGIVRSNLSNVNSDPQQISEINLDTETSAANIAGKSKKKCYIVNKREVRQRIYAYLNTQKGKKHLYFWTVSFPQGCPDDQCYRAFNTWLTSLRKVRHRKNGRGTYPPMLKAYIWVAERQENGTVHFHICIPHFMDVVRANAMMRGTLKNLSLQGAIPYKPHCIQLKKYNGVDICKNRKTGRIVNFAIKKGSRALASYLTKYVTKNDTAFEHLAWHNSREFSALFTGVTFTIKEFNEFGFGPFLNKVRVFKMNFALFIPWLFGPPPGLSNHLYQLNSYIQSLHDG